MRYAQGIMLGLLLLGCSGQPSPTYTTEPSPEDMLSRIPSAQKVLPVSGRVPIAELIYQLKKAEVINRLPPLGLIHQTPMSYVESDGKTTVADAIRAIEDDCKWIFDYERGIFYAARASHPVDAPDDFGRPSSADRAPLEPRPMVQLSIRFRRIQGSVDPNGLNFGGDGTVFSASVPDGIIRDWGKTSTRTYFEGLADANNPSTTVVRTQLREVESGLQVKALAARLPRGLFRVSGRVSVSAFTGRTGTDRAVVDFPLDVDGERGMWHRVTIIKSADAGVGVAFRQFDIEPRGSGDAIELCVKVN